MYTILFVLADIIVILGAYIFYKAKYTRDKERILSGKDKKTLEDVIDVKVQSHKIMSNIINKQIEDMNKEKR